MKKVVVLVVSILSLKSFAFVTTGIPAKAWAGQENYLDSFSTRIADTIFFSKPGLKPYEEKQHRLIPYIAPLAFISYGVMSLQNKTVIRIDHHLNHEMMEGKTHFSSSIEDKLRYAPVAAVYTLNAFGVNGKSNFIDRTAMYLMANSCSNLLVSLGKSNLQKQRPAGDLRSFPSGHTATAFTAAEFMHQEYKDTESWLGYAGYSFAIATGVLRMEHNKHWLSDVIGGAGVGILSTKLSYIVYPWLKEKLFHDKSKFMVLPSYGNNTVGLSLDASF